MQTTSTKIDAGVIPAPPSGQLQPTPNPAVTLAPSEQLQPTPHPAVTPAPSEEPQPAPNPAERCLTVAMPSLYPFLLRSTRQTLRLVCRSARTALDAVPPKLQYHFPETAREKADAAFALAALPARWPSAKEVHLHGFSRIPLGIKALPPKLERLSFSFGGGPEDGFEDEEDEEVEALRGRRNFQLLATVAPTLKELELEECNLDERGLVTLARVLPSLPSLRSFLLWADLGGDGFPGIEQLGPALKAMTQLTKLSIGAELDCAAIQALVPHIAAMPNLEVLQLPDSAMDRDGALVLSRVLRHLAPLGKLRELDLPGADLGYLTTDLDFTTHPSKLGFALLAPVIGSITSLRSLDISFNQLRQAFILLPAAGRSTLTGLTSLILSGNNLENQGALVAAMLERSPLLERLDLSHNGLGQQLCEPGGAKLVHALCGLTRLQKLLWGNDDFSDDHAPCMAQLCKVLRHLTGLVSLYLEDSRLGPAEGMALAGVLPHLTALTWLDLQSCSLARNPTTNTISSSAYDSHTITSQRLGAPAAPMSRVAEVLAKALVACHRLQTLQLGNNGWGVHEQKALLGAANQLPRLRSLELVSRKDKAFSAGDLRALVPELCALSVLQELSCLSVSCEDVAAAVDREVVQRALPQLNDLVF